MHKFRVINGKTDSMHSFEKQSGGVQNLRRQECERELSQEIKCDYEERRGKFMRGHRVKDNGNWIEFAFWIVNWIKFAAFSLHQRRTGFSEDTFGQAQKSKTMADVSILIIITIAQDIIRQACLFQCYWNKIWTSVQKIGLANFCKFLFSLQEFHKTAQYSCVKVAAKASKPRKEGGLSQLLVLVSFKSQGFSLNRSIFLT